MKVLHFHIILKTCPEMKTTSRFNTYMLFNLGNIVGNIVYHVHVQIVRCGVEDLGKCLDTVKIEMLMWISVWIVNTNANLKYWKTT